MRFEVERGRSRPPLIRQPAPTWYATDNDFATVGAMERAHAPLIELIQRTLGVQRGPVLDLGCGNGALLRRIVDACPKVEPYGVDFAPERIAHARELLPTWGASFFVGDLVDDNLAWDGSRRFVLALIMPGRLLESRPEQAARLRARLAKWCDRVLVYAYGDWLARGGDLTSLAARVGLEVIKESASEDGRAAFASVPVDSPVRSIEQDRSRCPCRVPDVLQEELEDELLLYCLGTAEAIALNSSARAVWELCDGTRTVNDIAAELGRYLDRASDDFILDVAASVTRLSELGLVEYS